MRTTRRSLALSALAFCTLAICASSAHADAVLSSQSERLFPEQIELNVEIRAQVEVSTYLLHFENVENSGDYVLTVPGPQGAYVIDVDMNQGAGFVQTAMVGEAPPPSLGGSNDAQDPDVAAWLGTDPLRADFAELEAGPLTVRVRFLRLLRRHEGEVAFDTGIVRSPLRPTSASAPAFTGTLVLSTSRSLVNLDVAGDGVLVNQQSQGATISWQSSGANDSRISILYREASADIDVHFLAHRTPSADPLGGTEGYFMLIVDAANASVASAQARTLSMVIDKSGSMEGQKMVQAKDAARAMLDHLGPQDAFNIVTFADGPNGFQDEPVTASAANIEAARDFIKDIFAGGGTNLNQGILSGLSGITTDPDQFDAMIVLSDGLATSGVTEPPRIHDNALLANEAKARMFTFSIGSGADRTLMEALARSNRGRHFDLNDAQATQEMLVRVNELFEDIRVVRLTDLEVDADSVGAEDVLPEQMHDLFSGGQAVLVGRYSSPVAGTAAVRITGNDNGAGFLRSISVSAPEVEDDNAFIKHLWASEKVGALLAQMSTGGNYNSLRSQIIELGLAYRIQTPFTSFAAPPGGGGGGGGGGNGSGGGWSGGGELDTPASRLPSGLLAALLALGSVVLWRRRRSQC